VKLKLHGMHVYTKTKTSKHWPRMKAKKKGESEILKESDKLQTLK